MRLIIYWLIRFIGVLISIPFFTLYERKILSYIQNRKGPNKISFLGLLQPVADGVKLIIKESSFPAFSNFSLFKIAPLISFILMVLIWSIFPFYFNGFFINLSLLGFLCLTSFNVYSLIGSGWRSNSKYSLLGSIRGATQVISYEVSMIFIILFPSFIFFSYKIWGFYFKFKFYFLLRTVLIIVWLIIVLTETNRAPFDFAEGERELVSGFNTEYRALGFAYLFLGEYGRIILMRVLTIILFFYTHRWLTREVIDLHQRLHTWKRWAMRTCYGLRGTDSLLGRTRRCTL